MFLGLIFMEDFCRARRWNRCSRWWSLICSLATRHWVQSVVAAKSKKPRAMLTSGWSMYSQGRNAAAPSMINAMTTNGCHLSQAWGVLAASDLLGLGIKWVNFILWLLSPGNPIETNSSRFLYSYTITFYRKSLWIVCDQSILSAWKLNW